jgi:hypothetical protein
MISICSLGMKPQITFEGGKKKLLIINCSPLITYIYIYINFSNWKFHIYYDFGDMTLI